MVAASGAAKIPRNGRGVVQDLGEQRAIAPHADMDNPPGLRAHTRPEPRQELARPLRHQAGLIDDHKIEARRMPGRPLRRQGLQAPRRRQDLAGIGRAPNIDLRQPARLGDRCYLRAQFGGFFFRDRSDCAAPAVRAQRADKMPERQHRTDGAFRVLAGDTKRRFVRSPTGPQEVDREIRERHRLAGQRMPGRNLERRRGPARQLAHRIGRCRHGEHRLGCPRLRRPLPLPIPALPLTAREPRSSGVLVGHRSVTPSLRR